MTTTSVALAEPSTLAAALSDHAQRTDGAWRFSRRSRPLGNGIPISRAAGATARVVNTSFAANGQPAVHRLLPLSVTFDHRAVTGGEAGRFLRAMIEDLQRPA